MTNQSVIIDTPLLRQLLRSGKAGELIAKGVPGGFVLAMREGLDEQLLGAQRGHARKFRRLESVASYLKDLGAHQFTVDIGFWESKSLDV